MKWLSWVAPLVLCPLVCTLLYADRRPRPVYDRFHSDEVRPLPADEPLDVPLKLSRAPSKVIVPVIVHRHGASAVLALTDADGNALTTQIVSRWSDVVLRVPDDFAGSSLGLRLQATDTGRPPDVKWVPAKEAPLFLVVYPQPSRWALLLWLLVPVGLLITLRTGRGAPLLLALGAAAMATSIFLWQRDYTIHFGHFDADRYGQYAQRLASALRDPGTWPAVARWLRHYPQTHTGLVSWIIAVPVALGVQPALAYLVLSSLCSFASLGSSWRILRRHLKTTLPVAVVFVIVFAAHVLMLRSFARPVADAVGLLLTLFTLEVLFLRMKEPRRWQLAVLALLLVLHPLARPQGVIYFPAILAALAWIDLRRSGMSLRTVGPVLVTLAIPTAAMAALYLAGGWIHNAELMMEKAAGFRDAFSWHHGWPAVVGVCQVIPVWWVGLRRTPKRRESWILSGWLGIYVVMLLVVRAPLWPRHFLPVLPSIVLLGALGLQQASGSVRRWSFVILGALASVNVAAALYVIWHTTHIPYPWFLMITSP